ncbi:MAG: protein kinase [Nannocystis sp.]|uniref:serine/threonine protein kinase n=1 Tax=Nannocystis sp. TaxID=1962667 RepID=UPI002429C1A2|nr:serine/threonine protein kinase [Nannocystis sp.]MBK9753811.1 protein kinase [Nannocystis sp.]
MNQITQFGPYKLIERISVGGMAEVYKATEHGVEGFERTVAVKRILPHIAEDDEFITMFKDEAKIAGQLQHGNIAQIYNLGQQGDSFYIALEYVAGKDLRNIFTRCQQQGRAMPIAQACFIVMKVGEGLDYAHNKRDKHGRHLNIVHRDVSPPNVLVSYEGEVKLIDFGVAKAAGRVSRTQAGILKGKFGYMSPEQVRGMPLDRRSDVFSLGVVLFETLVGQRLFQGDTDFATLEMVRTVDVPAPSSKNPEIPKDLEAIIMKALSGEPETRYQTAMELHDDLQAFMFQHGMFYSRKDLAAWMRKQYAREIELEKDKNTGKSAPPRPAPPGAAAGRKPTLSGVPAPKAAPPAAPPTPAAGAPRPPPAVKPPPGSPGPKPPAVGLPKPGAGDALEPTEEQLAAARKRSKTMLMSPSNRPTTLKPGATGAVPTIPAGLAAMPKPADPLKQTIVPGGAPPPAVVAPKIASVPLHPPTQAPRPTVAPVAKAAPSSEDGPDLDWDDDELETKLFDEPGGPGAPGAPAMAASVPSAARSKVKPEEAGSIAPLIPKVGQIEADEDDGPATVQLPPNAAAVIIQPLMAAAAAAAAAAQSMPGGSMPGGSMPGGAMPGASMSGGAMPSAPGFPQQSSPGLPQPPRRGQQTMPTPELADVEDTETGKRKPNFLLIGGIAAGVLLLIVVIAMFSGGGDKPGEVASNDSGTPAAASGGAVPGPTVGGLQIEVSPADAKILVDGAEVPGSGSSRVVNNLAVGKHKLTVNFGDAYLPFEQEVDVVASQLANFPVKLSVRDVTVTVTTEPAEAALKLIEGQNPPTVVGKGGDSFKVQRKPGATYKLLAELAGYDPSEIPLTFTGGPNDSAKLVLIKSKAGTPPTPPETTPPIPTPPPGEVTPPKPKDPKPKQPPKAKTAELKIGSGPGLPPATVWVDGQKQPKPTPVTVMVTAGAHTVKWKYPDGKTTTKKVTAADKSSQVIKGTL